jgi:hypothetical protein
MPSATQVRAMFRSVARNMVEPHPFARNPVSMAPHSWRAGDLSKRFVRTSAVYVFSLSSRLPILHPDVPEQVLPLLRRHSRLARRRCKLLQWQDVTLFGRGREKLHGGAQARIG